MRKCALSLLFVVLSLAGMAQTITSVTVSCPSTVYSSQTASCTATVSGTGSYSSAVTWSVTFTQGSINSNGVLTPVEKATVKAVSVQDRSKSGTTFVTVLAGSPPASSITSVSASCNPSSITTAQTSTCGAIVNGTGPYNSAVTWSAIGGTISASGVLTPSAAGTATVTAISAQDPSKSGSASVTVTAVVVNPTITGVNVACSPTSITPTQTSTCTAVVTGTGSYNPAVTWTATNGAVSSAGIYTPSAAGTGVVTATSVQDTTKKGTASITVASVTPSACNGMSLGAMASLNGFVPFPASNPWNTDISNAPLDPNNAAITSAAGFSGLHLHHDWSSVSGGNYGIPYLVVDSSTTPLVPLNIVAYAGNSDVANAPFPANAPIEGYPGTCVGGPGKYVNDQHILVLDRNTCKLYETFNTAYCNGTYSADSETIWDLNNYESRPYGWTSADAAGLPIFPGLVRYDEVASGVINHAIRFTMQQTKQNSNDGFFVSPATHAAGSNTGTYNVIGMRIRLKASFDISGYSATNQVILTAMKKYGMILADNGSYFFFQGTPDARWNDNDLLKLDAIQSSNFEVVQMSPAFPGYDSTNWPKGSAPTINSFTASASTVSAGTQVTLSWSTTNDSYDFIDKLGGVNGTSITVSPTATTTYTLNATNAFGRSTKAVTVTVQ